MKSLSTFITESKNLHMEHLEDLILNNGVAGAQQIFRFLTSMRDMLAGHSSGKTSATVKWDGAPAIFAGIDPADEKFFVAKKGLFNKEPIMYKSQSDIDKELSGELHAKFTVAFREFKKLGITSGVYQGDLLFTDDVKTETIDGEKYYTFHPNTIVYAVPVNSPLGAKIKRASIGVVWHTTYTGSSIKKMKATFGKNIVNKFKSVSTIWMDDATYKDISGNATFTKEETEKFNEILSRAGTILQKLPREAVNAFSQDEDLLLRVKTFNNSKIRVGKPIGNTVSHVRDLVIYLTDFYKKELESKVSEKGKQAVKEKFKPAFRIISSTPLLQLKSIFDFMNTVIEAKHMLIAKMNNSATINTFLRTKQGITVTSPEGYVAIDHLTDGAVKLVDRLNFSYSNFSPDIIKGWQR
jgi:hypothetical protein